MRFVLGVIFLLLAGCAVQPQGPNRYQLEFEAYVRYLDSEVKARRMSDEQAKYLAIAKYNQLRSQLDAENAAQSARIGDAYRAAGSAMQSNPSGAATIQPSRSINCTSYTPPITGITTTTCY